MPEALSSGDEAGEKPKANPMAATLILVAPAELAICTGMAYSYVRCYKCKKLGQIVRKPHVGSTCCNPYNGRK